jgi:hypothetical protein
MQSDNCIDMALVGLGPFIARCQKSAFEIEGCVVPAPLELVAKGPLYCFSLRARRNDYRPAIAILLNFAFWSVLHCHPATVRAQHEVVGHARDEL